MSKIDDIFKKGLAQKGLGYTDDYWKEMEVLLDGNKKGFIIKNKWVLFLLALFTIGGMCYTLIPRKEQPTRVIQNAFKQPSKINSASIHTYPTTSTNNNTTKIAQKSKFNKPKQANIIDKVSIEKSIAAQESGVATPHHKNNIAGKKAQKQSTPSSTFDKANDFGNNKNTRIKAAMMHLNSRAFYLFPEYLNEPFSPKTKQIIGYKLPKWYFYLAPYLQLNQLTNKVQLATESHLKKEEKPLATLGYGLNVLAKKGKWVVKTGLNSYKVKVSTNYSDVQKTFTYDTSFKLVILNYTQTPRGSNVALLQNKIDTIAGNSQSVVNCVDCITQFNFVSIPLALQYEWRKNRFIYFAELGTALSFLTKSKGIYAVSETTNSPLLVKDLANVEKTINKTQWQINGAIGIKFRVIKNISIWSSYAYNYGVSSMFNTYSQKSRTQQLNLGLELGLR